MKQQTVYIVLTGSFEDYELAGVYSSLETAQKAVVRFQQKTNLEWFQNSAPDKETKGSWSTAYSGLWACIVEKKVKTR